MPMSFLGHTVSNAFCEVVLSLVGCIYSRPRFCACVGGLVITSSTLAHAHSGIAFGSLAGSTAATEELAQRFFRTASSASLSGRETSTYHRAPHFFSILFLTFLAGFWVLSFACIASRMRHLVNSFASDNLNLEEEHNTTQHDAVHTDTHLANSFCRG